MTTATIDHAIAVAKAEAQRRANADGVPYLVGQTDGIITVVSYVTWLRDTSLNYDNIWTIQPEAGR